MVRNVQLLPENARNDETTGGWVEISDLVHHLTFLASNCNFNACGWTLFEGVVKPGGAWWCQARARRLQKAMRKFWLLRTRQRDGISAENQESSGIQIPFEYGFV